MKSILIASLVMVAVIYTVRAESEIWVVSNGIDIIARQVQATIPTVSFDKLHEARREKDGWSYIFWNKYGKTWVEEIHIRLSCVSVKETKVQVEAYRIEHGMVFKGKEQRQDLVQSTCSWLRKIK